MLLKYPEKHRNSRCQLLNISTGFHTVLNVEASYQENYHEQCFYKNENYHILLFQMRGNQGIMKKIHPTELLFIISQSNPDFTSP